jgi:rRNA-processing protein EBP2
MVTKSKLKMALAADKGIDFKKLHLKKKEKEARKAKSQKGGEKPKSKGKNTEEDWEDVDEESEDGGVELSGEESASEEEGEETGPMQVSFLCLLSLYILTWLRRLILKVSMKATATLPQERMTKRTNQRMTRTTKKISRCPTLKTSTTKKRKI